MLTRLGGQPMALNPDLIEKAEATPDTVITMVDGHKLVVAEPVTEVVELVRAWRASVAAEAFAMSAPAGPRRPRSPMPPGPADDEEVTVTADPGQGTAAMARVLHLPAREE